MLDPSQNNFHPRSLFQVQKIMHFSAVKGRISLWNGAKSTVFAEGTFLLWNRVVMGGMGHGKKLKNLFEFGISCKKIVIEPLIFVSKDCVI